MNESKSENSTYNSMQRVLWVLLLLLVILLCGYFVYTRTGRVVELIRGDTKEMTLEEMEDQYMFARLQEQELADSPPTESASGLAGILKEDEEVITVSESEFLKIKSQIKTGTMTSKERAEVLAELNKK